MYYKIVTILTKLHKDMITQISLKIINKILEPLLYLKWVIL